MEPSKKRTKLKDAREIPELKLPERTYAPLEPTVIWRSREMRLCPSPPPDLITRGQGKKVAILEDWRERFKSSISEHGSREAGQHLINTEFGDLVRGSELDPVPNDGDDATIMPPSSLMGQDYPEAPTENSESATCRKNSSSNDVLGLPGSQLRPTTARKRKGLHFDNQIDRTMTGRNSLNTVESAQPAQERPNCSFGKRWQRKAPDETQ